MVTDMSPPAGRRTDPGRLRLRFRLGILSLVGGVRNCLFALVRRIVGRIRRIELCIVARGRGDRQRYESRQRGKQDGGERHGRGKGDGRECVREGQGGVVRTPVDTVLDNVHGIVPLRFRLACASACKQRDCSHSARTTVKLADLASVTFSSPGNKVFLVHLTPPRSLDPQTCLLARDDFLRSQVRSHCRPQRVVADCSPLTFRSLPDSEQLVHGRATTHLALLPSFAHFLSTLTTLQRDFAQKASSHIGSFRVQIARTASERGGEAASLERAMSGVLEQVDLMSREVGECADKVAKEVAARLDEVGGRLEAVKKKVRMRSYNFGVETD